MQVSHESCPSGQVLSITSSTTSTHDLLEELGAITLQHDFPYSDLDLEAMTSGSFIIPDLEEFHDLFSILTIRLPESEVSVTIRTGTDVTTYHYVDGGWFTAP